MNDCGPVPVLRGSLSRGEARSVSGQLTQSLELSSEGVEEMGITKSAGWGRAEQREPLFSRGEIATFLEMHLIQLLAF